MWGCSTYLIFISWLIFRLSSPLLNYLTLLEGQRMLILPWVDPLLNYCFDLPLRPFPSHRHLRQRLPLAEQLLVIPLHPLQVAAISLALINRRGRHR